jgi:hypothetical protein
MAQLFHPAANTIAKVSLIALVAAPPTLLGVAASVSRSPYNTKVNVPLDQPIPFSHEHHSTELGIDCRYCHVGVEQNAYASLPATETCMSCHSQIWTNSPLLKPVRDSWTTGTPIAWNVVNKVPEFVYFNHSIHIDRGVKCNNCHGAIQKMQLAAKGKTFFMSWCLNCHRNPENYVGKPEDVFKFYEKYQQNEGLTPEEKALAAGLDYHRSPEEVAEGQRLVKEYGIKTKTLSDCWICHR